MPQVTTTYLSPERVNAVLTPANVVILLELSSIMPAMKIGLLIVRISGQSQSKTVLDAVGIMLQHGEKLYLS